MKIVVDKLIKKIIYDNDSQNDPNFTDDPEFQKGVVEGKYTAYGVTVEAQLKIMYPTGGSQRIGSIHSGGLWGIFLDSNTDPKNDKDIKEVALEQYDELAEILHAMGISILSKSSMEAKVDY